MATERIYGLIGYPLEHSFSKTYFTEKFQREHLDGCTYDNFPIPDIELFPDILKNPKLSGLNVTIPYKEQVIPYLSELDPVAREIGAVNVIRIARDNGRVICTGFNTDAYGFETSLTPLLSVKHTTALVLGTGGAAKAVIYVLNKLGMKVTLAGRTANASRIPFEQVNEKLIREHLLVVNTTPLGMHPNTEGIPPLPYHALSSDHVLYDLVYNPSETRFLLEGKKAGCKTENGLKMLHLQAEKAWETWNR
ncbi:MAG: shikimate dehydrogenase [Flavobacteriales bacterium]|nr:shikimate dehydrogenase [Flavobacteriales bacterium]MCB9448232.1 shikimate dehydrogenase [Flavobacteriales bacterium]